MRSVLRAIQRRPAKSDQLSRPARALRWNPAILIATVALLFAMTGGAFAVSHHGHSAKVKKGVPGKSGPAGSAGPVGPAGPQGPQGQIGPAGAKGERGAAGIEGARGPQGEPGERGEPGVQGEKGATGETGPKGERGQEGSPWTVSGKLPSGKTETGTWSAGPFETEGVQDVPISFPIPLAFPFPETQIHFLQVGEPPTPECPGSIEVPKATSGNLCVYAEVLQELSLGLAGSYTSGIIVQADHGSQGVGIGTWAVTGEQPRTS